ncbi:hypothetical protein L5515_015525 [Caenorhabditis briggsae]|uniref:Uncharacterized protein n=2 Tax=Caenorhabditis briggsae TaxID=6238 RepID=A0AAE9J9E3_CAEBR|nr:hypothetical protein L5515_015525 [Caenorhabditis briggsae]
MSILLKVLALVAVFQFSSAHRQTSLTDEQVLQLVQLSCNDAKYFCPAERCLVKIGPQRIFNRTLFIVFRNTFCCTEGACLEECHIYPINEKRIVSNFQDIFKQVFALNIAELDSYESDYIEYLTNGKKLGFVPARVEELYDILHENEDNPRVAFHVWPSSLAPRLHRTTRLIVESSETDLLQLIVAPPDAGIVGTNTSLGPARLLVDSRKRDSLIGNRAAVPPTIKRQTPLVTYNGGRPGQEIPRYIDLDDSPALSPRRSPPTSLDIQKMLREQPAVKMEVKMGGGGYVKYQKPEDVEEDFEDSDDGESEDVPKSDLAQKIKKTKERVSEEAAIIVFS